MYSSGSARQKKPSNTTAAKKPKPNNASGNTTLYTTELPHRFRAEATDEYDKNQMEIFFKKDEASAGPLLKSSFDPGASNSLRCQVIALRIMPVFF